jgi:predicted SprT family Zn-dependent metalloprotease
MDTRATSRFADIWQPSRPLPAKRVLRDLAGRCLELWGETVLFSRVQVVYNPRLRTTLGRAVLDALRVELNPRLLREHPDQLLSTLAHELAHLVVHVRHRRSAPHGREFRELMRAMDFSPRATHRLPVEHLRRRRGKYLYLHRCGDCGYSFVATRAKRGYYCLACGPDMTWDIFRLPNNPAGRSVADRILRTANRR